MKRMTLPGAPGVPPLLAAAAIVIVVFGLKYSSDVMAPIFLAATLAILFTPALCVDEAPPTRHGPWILNWSLPQNVFWQVGVFRMVVVIGLLFYLLLTLSMLLYPGGTKADHNTQSYSFFTNFLSDLGHTVSISGQPNIPSMVLFISALIMGAIATGLFSLAFTQLFTLSAFTIGISRLGALNGLIAGLCIFGVAVVPEDLSSRLHNFCIYAALVVFVAAYLLFFLALVRTKGLPKRVSWVYIALGVVLIIYTIISVWVTFFGPAPSGNSGVGSHPGHGAEDYRLCRCASLAH